MVSTLLAAGASAAATDEDGKTPLVWAASQGHEAAVGQHVGMCRLGSSACRFATPSFGALGLARRTLLTAAGRAPHGAREEH